MYICFTDIAHVVGDLEVVDEGGAELGVEVQHVQQIVAVHAMQVAVRERAHAAIASSHRRVDARVLTKYIVFSC